MKTTATVNQLQDALNYVNQKYDNNIVFKAGPTQVGNRRQFTLTVRDSKGLGGRMGRHGRRIAAACWHVHGDFFEYLFDQGVSLIIAGDKRMKSNKDNWQDWNIGSYYFPMYYSEACNC